MNYNTIITKVARESLGDNSVWDYVYLSMKNKLLNMNLEELDNHTEVISSPERKIWNRKIVADEIEKMAGYRVEIVEYPSDEDCVIAMVKIHSTNSMYAKYQWGDGE